MSLIDGYVNSTINLDIIDRITGKRLKEEPFIELHDTIASFIRFEKPNKLFYTSKGIPNYVLKYKKGISYVVSGDLLESRVMLNLFP